MGQTLCLGNILRIFSLENCTDKNSLCLVQKLMSVHASLHLRESWNHDGPNFSRGFALRLQSRVTELPIPGYLSFRHFRCYPTISISPPPLPSLAPPRYAHYSGQGVTKASVMHNLHMLNFHLRNYLYVCSQSSAEDLHSATINM